MKKIVMPKTSGHIFVVSSLFKQKFDVPINGTEMFKLNSLDSVLIGTALTGFLGGRQSQGMCRIHR